MNQPKVVELNIQAASKTTLPPILHAVRQHAKKQLNELLQNLFNNTDDALFELADRSASNQDQNMYFDSMRCIRIHRKSMSTAFMRGFYASFDAAYQPTVEADAEEQTEPEEYSLLQKDDLEMSVAISGIVSKITSQFSLPIMQLTKRLDSLAKSSTISERTNPLGPHELGHSFAATLEAIDVHIKVRIILLKLFERFVMERMGPIYEHANQLLIEADVLPDLKLKSTRSVRSPAAASPRNQTAGGGPAGTQDHPTIAQAGSSSVGGSLGGTAGGIGGYGGAAAPASTISGGSGGGFGFSTIQSLLAQGRPSGISAEYTDGGNTLQPAELLQALSVMQTSSRQHDIDITQVPVINDLRPILLQQAGGDDKSLGQADDDAVNFVGMLFDYILNDKNLAIPMKALIGRLQIPIVKLCIIDKTFFERSTHPARILLNELSSAGIGWSSANELKRDHLYNKIESIVVRVLDEFSENPEIFQTLLEELRTFVNKDKKRSVLVEQRVKESESGKAKTQAAKLTVQQLVNQKASGLRLPAEAGKFISETWSRYLVLCSVKHGERSEDWVAAVRSLDDLLWVLQPLSDIQDIEQRDRRIAPLTREITLGMQSLDVPDEEQQSFRQWLSEHLSALSDNDRAFIEEDERPDMELALQPVEEVVLTTVEFEDDGEFDAIEPEFVAELKKLTEGTWIELRLAGSTPLRCKLATVTQPGNNFIFVNRRGMKVLEKRRMDLATHIKQGELSLIDESQVFDRALQSVIGNLRQLQRDKS